MESKKGKPVTTSVPSITIKFHANGEQLEELYTKSDEESATTDVSTTTIANESDKSPLKLFPRFVKRSTSIDINQVKQQQTDNSPPSDPWRFFSDIKGKITKSVEDRITEIKSRNHDDGGSPSKQLKDNSNSLSDSEEISESSLSKTCGLLSSTTEGVEMSTDDDINNDHDDVVVGDDDDDDDHDGTKRKLIKKTRNLRQRFKLLKSSSSSTKQKPINNSITINNLTKLYNINTDRIEQALPEINDNDNGVEDAVEAIEDEYDKKIINSINENYDNIEIDKQKFIRIHEIQGDDLKKFDKSTVFAPIGFVDMRHSTSDSTIDKTKPIINTNLIIIIVIFIIYVLLYCYSTYWSGVFIGIITTHLFIKLKFYLSPESIQSSHFLQYPQLSQNIIEIDAAEEYQPLKKYEGWINELPEVYDANLYHINKTQTVYLRLQGNLLRVSHTRMKIPKRAVWNERNLTKPTFTHHRIYNLLNSKIQLLPKGLAKKRYWSKKYPICITLADQMGFETDQPSQQQQQDDSIDDDDDLLKTNKPKLSINQQFSKLAADDENLGNDSEHSHASTPQSSSSTFDLTEHFKNFDVENDEDDRSLLSEAWSTIDECQPNETKLYIFARSCREKEEWFRRLQLATVTNNGQQSIENVDELNTEINYLKYMQYFNKNLQLDSNELDKIKEDLIKTETHKLLEEYCLSNILWINTLIGRVLFDCLYNNMSFTQKVRERIQRKLTTIKLPYFIEELLITELKLGHTPPIIHKAKKPTINERGLWIDLDITYEGLIVLILQTKLNLMKLKHPQQQEKMQTDEKSAIFNSDIDDSAESSSDDNLSITEPQQLLDQSNVINNSGGGGAGNKSSKTFIRMVDKIAESKLFQAAAENRLIKRAMENVSNTDLGLRCELKQLIGTLVINIPTPPSDRLWIGFQPTPTILMKAQPIVGETNISYLRITGWIEKKLVQEFQKVLVIPNMEDLIIPLLTPKIVE